MGFKASAFVRVALLAGTLPLSAMAQQATDDTQLEEIVVTAQKREQSLRDVPLSVEAVSGAKLADAGIVRLDDLKAYVPNLQMTETGIANNIYIRGIGSGLNQGFEQSVSTYADGIYRGRGHQSRMPFLDLERVEVLRGPQPILFGKNAVAGAVNLVAAHPGKDFESSLRLSRDFANDDDIGNLVLSGPLSDRVGGRLAVYGRRADGYIYNSTLDRGEPARRDLGGRLTFDFDVSDALKVSWRTEAGRYDTWGRQIEIFGETGIVPTAANPLTVPLAGLTYSRIVGGPTLPQLNQGQDASALNNTIDHVRSSNGDDSRLHNFETAVTVDYKLADALTLTSISGYSGYTLDEHCDCDFVGASVFDAGITEDYDQYSQELRLTSPIDQPVSWIGGVFFQKYTLHETDYLHVPANSLVVPVLRLNPSIGAAAAYFANAVNPRDFEQDSKLYSAFLQGTWSATEQFKISAGGRFNKEDKDGSRVTTLTTGFGGPSIPTAVLPLFAGALGIIPHSISGSRSESNFSPLINFQYSLTPESMAYFSWSQGYKSGGFDARSNKPPSAGGTFEFEDERATTYELGLKSGIGTNADINADVFYTNYKDLQTSAFDGAIGFNVGNGSAHVKGAELEGRWRPVRGLTLSGSLAYLDFEWTNYYGQCYFGRTPDGTGVNANNCNYDGFGNQLAPKFTGVLSANYRWMASDTLAMNAALDAVHSSQFLTSLTLDPATTQAAYTKLNARLSMGDNSGHWELALVGRNLTDKTTISYSGDTPLAARLFGARSYYGFVDPPRSIAVEVSLRY